MSERTPTDAAPLDIWDPSFAGIAQRHELNLRAVSGEEAAESVLAATLFVFDLLRSDSQLRRHFPHALSEGEGGAFYKWLAGAGGTALGLSAKAQTTILSAFRQRAGERVYQIYLNNPELQGIYRLGLLPVGQAHFLGWLTTHGRRDHQLTNEQIVWFLTASSEDLERGLTLTYLLRPSWQERFPLALTDTGWPPFQRWVLDTYGNGFAVAALRDVPSILSPPLQQALRRSVKSDGRALRATELEGVNLLSHFCNPSGIQQAALWAKAGLERSRLRTSCRDVPVPRRSVPIDRSHWLGLEIFPITILTHAATPYFFDAYERSGLFRRENVYRIAYWNWELETIPDEWVAVAPLINEIWSPTGFVAQAMRSRMPLPVYNMLPGVEVGPIESIPRASLGVPENDFVFIFMFDLHSQIHRKNPLGVIGAFQKAFRKDDAVTLIIKTSGGDIHGSDLAVLQEMTRDDKIILVDKMMSRAAAYGMIAMADCFVSLHRSEGFGLGLAEAMLMGKPVIATGYSGNLAFMNHENSLLVDYKITEIAEDRPLYTKGNFWAEPSVEHASSLMRKVYERREEALRRALLAQPEIARLLSLEAAGQRMRRRLEKCTALESNQQPAD